MTIVRDSSGVGVGKENPLPVSAGAERAVSVTTHNTNDIPVTKGIYVGGGGDLRVNLVGSGTAVTFVGLAPGVIHPLNVTRVYTTGTTATAILAVY